MNIIQLGDYIKKEYDIDPYALYKMEGYFHNPENPNYVSGVTHIKTDSPILIKNNKGEKEKYSIVVNKYSKRIFRIYYNEKHEIVGSPEIQRGQYPEYEPKIEIQSVDEPPQMASNVLGELEWEFLISKAEHDTARRLTQVNITYLLNMIQKNKDHYNNRAR